MFYLFLNTHDPPIIYIIIRFDHCYDYVHKNNASQIQWLLYLWLKYVIWYIEALEINYGASETWICVPENIVENVYELSK